MARIVVLCIALLPYCLEIAQAKDILNSPQTSNQRVAKMCYKCTGLECYRAEFANQTVTCADIADDCVTIYQEQIAIERGCYDEIPDELRNKCGSVTNSKCERCSTLLCNENAHPDIQCAQCTSAEDPYCLREEGMDTGPCPFAAGYEPLCTIKYDGTNTVRGCSGSLSDGLACSEDNNCYTCSGVGCNRIPFPHGRRSCYTCEGLGVSYRCDERAGYKMLCKKLDDKCITMKIGQDVVRGCLNEMEDTQRKSCTAKSCWECSSNNCNTYIPPMDANTNAAPTKILSSMTMFILILLRMF